MTLIQVWGCLLIFVLCPLLGGIPASEWLIQRLPARSRISWRYGATFLEVGIEASKGIASVCLARYYFPRDPTWWLIALIALVFGQFWLRKSKQLLGIVAGGMVYSWQIAFLLLLIGGISITLLRERRIGRLGLLVLFPLLVGLYTQQSSQIMAAMGLSFVIAWVDEQVPQPPASMGSSPSELMTLDPANDAHLFGFFQRDRNIRTLDHSLKVDQVGPLAVALSQLKADGYNIPPGWVLPPGDDAAPLIQLLNPSAGQPLMIRSSVIGADPVGPPPEPVFQITSRRALAQVIRACRSAYSATHSSPHSQDQGVAVMVQVQVKGQYSGLVRSRDLPNSDPDTMIIIGGPGPTPTEALMHPQMQQIRVSDLKEAHSQALQPPQSLPSELVQKITTMARFLEAHYHGIPQQIEWSDDGDTLWILAVSAIQE
ncbi:PEP/pyruvate-binding domain-containing protein [Acaryochloris marina]|uniref:Uncharacterized protein n=1 Tax=Acaryochloris marina (strain MBIC 11017) TaxID=329726 RepID=B0C080_ACAM1|nr:PEP/pyruvate-binding domain-containing protein [Acaryochloris marina]ABW29572.1 hypothetical protein AM1_4598 [Acaryochloris marina MBIC11017]BDM78477.1 hypothetical protein AM10699_13460 [Acaryochloris marina MBIC10699]